MNQHASASQPDFGHRANNYAATLDGKLDAIGVKVRPAARWALGVQTPRPFVHDVLMAMAGRPIRVPPLPKPVKPKRVNKYTGV